MTTYRLLTPIFLALRQHIEFWPPFFGAHRFLSPWVPGSLPGFIYYLAKALEDPQPGRNYSMPKDLDLIPDMGKDHNYYISKPDYFVAEPKYADDITYASTAPQYTKHIEETIPKGLQSYYLKVNADKTAHFIAPYQSKSNKQTKRSNLERSELD